MKVNISYKTKPTEVTARVAEIAEVYGQRIRGRFDSVEDAFSFYKKNKEEYLKYLAESYKSLIPHKLYEAMINYEVEVDD